jgi:KDO2-lipid IV(A) lauroyltransferase
VIGALIWVLGRLPRPALLRLGRVCGWLWFHLIPIRRGVALAQMQRAFPEWEEARVRATTLENFKQTATTFAEGALIPHLAPKLPAWYSHQGFEHYWAARVRGKGVIVITGHVGNFDLFGVLQSIAGYALTIVVRPIKNQALDARWNAMRARFGTRVLIARRRMGAMKEILAELKAGRSVALLIDQNMNRDKGVFVDFFGQAACTMELPALLAKRTGAAIVPAFMVRRPDGGHHAIILPEVRWRSGDGDLVRNTQAHTQVVEDMVRRYPAQWLWVHRRWKSRP